MRKTNDKLLPDVHDSRNRGVLQEFSMSMNSDLSKSHNEKLKTHLKHQITPKREVKRLKNGSSLMDESLIKIKGV